MKLTRDRKRRALKLLSRVETIEVESRSRHTGKAEGSRAKTRLVALPRCGKSRGTAGQVGSGLFSAVQTTIQHQFITTPRRTWHMYKAQHLAACRGSTIPASAHTYEKLQPPPPCCTDENLFNPQPFARRSPSLETRPRPHKIVSAQHVQGAQPS